MKKKTLAFISTVIVTLAFGAGLAFLPVHGAVAQDSALRVLTSDGMKPAVEELVPQIEHSIGRKVATQFDSSKNLRAKIQAGEQFDVAILTSDVIDDLIRLGRIATGTRAEISRTGMGIGVRAGAPKPDVGTPDALKQTLLNAKFIAFNPTGASAAHNYEMFERLGIAAEVKPKLILNAEPGGPQRNVAEGKADLVLTLIPEIRFFPGVELAGQVPAEFQSYVNFAAGVATNTRQAEAAKALIQFITGPMAAPVLKAKGQEPRRNANGG